MFNSIREGQVDEYFELARAQFPDLHIDIVTRLRMPPVCRIGHVTGI